MDQIGLEKSSNTMVDMENGVTSSENDDEVVQVLRLDGNAAKKKLGRLRSGSLAESGRSSGGLNSIEDGLSSCENLEILVGKMREKETSIMEKKMVKEKRKQKSSPKPPSKPPRPPGGLSLQPADISIVREISELARLKHARNERLKALRKKRAEKASSASSSTNILAMVITILFFLVIIFQGIVAVES
ncbi:hypothetical protein Tsubulata_016810 [Turnera subulata]|uniref:Uncharacterized protein n=1 Tax=Turnera subulata TaxID=218843 RepID=A0A9Q0F4Z8_9ROSI|nr:hypothetical protein Tsubulata_016810 [Turnera subulata]